MTFRRSGLNPLAYMGVEPIPLSPDVAEPRDPTINDINYNLLTRWLNTDNQFIWVLVNLNAGIATWVHLTTNIGPFPPGEINKVTTDDTLQVIADANNNINIFGAHGINTTGSANPFPNTVTVRVNNTLTLGDEADVGAAASLTLESGILEIVDGNAVIGNTDVGPLASEVIFEKSRAGGAINTGDDLGGIVFQGFDGTGYTTGAEIISESSGTVAAGRIAANLQFFTHPDSVVAATQRMVINPDGSVLINFPDAGGADALTVTGNIDVPNTNTAGTQGVIKYGGNRFITNFGTNNTFIGSLSGNTTVTGNANVSVGTNTGVALTSGDANTLLGTDAGTALTTGSGNSIIGSNAGLTLLTGSDNILLGEGSGIAYVSSESSNIIVGSSGVVGDSNTIRIGAQGAGAGHQNRAFMAGINGVTLAPGFNAVVIDPATNQLGVSTFPGGSSSTVITQFNTPGTFTWTKNVNAKWIQVFVFGGGAGGGSGRRGASTAAGGGGGGGGGSFVFSEAPAVSYGATQTVLVGAGGAGGAAVTVNNTDGNDGGAATRSSFGNVIAFESGLFTGGPGGINGTTGGGPGGQIGYVLNQANGYIPSGGAPGVLGGGSFVASGLFGMGSTGGGGGGSGANSVTPQAGGAGGFISAGGGTISLTPIILGGAGGISGGTINGGPGLDGLAPGDGLLFGGTGGGGGGGQSTVGGAVAGIGGDGGFPAGGGGGGGGSINGTNSGAGGAGGDGAVWVIEYL